MKQQPSHATWPHGSHSLALLSRLHHLDERIRALRSTNEVILALGPVQAVIATVVVRKGRKRETCTVTFGRNTLVALALRCRRDGRQRSLLHELHELVETTACAAGKDALKKSGADTADEPLSAVSLVGSIRWRVLPDAMR